MDTASADYSKAKMVDCNAESLIDQTAAPMRVGEVVLLPSTDSRSGRASLGDRQFIQVEMFLSQKRGGEGMGLFVRFTPEGARMIAADLIETASLIEAEVARTASAAFERARAAGKPQGGAE